VSGPNNNSGSVDNEGSAQSATVAAVTDKLRTEILAGGFAPGERLGQEMLADYFGASRMPVRIALRQLESEGLVTIVEHSGAWVSKPDRFEFDQVYKMREALEPLAIGESVPHLEQQQIEYIVSVAKRLHAATVPNINIEDFLYFDRTFHLLTYAGVMYSPLRIQVERLWNTTQHYRRTLATHMTRHDAQMTDHDHSLIVDAVERRDAESASTLVRLHIYRTRQMVGSYLEIFS